MQPDHQDHLAHQIRVLGHPKRLQLLHALRQEPLRIADLAEKTGLSHATVNDLIRPLKWVGLAHMARLGRDMVLSLGPRRDQPGYLKQILKAYEATLGTMPG